jgi:anthranilate synthase component 1
LFFEKGGKMKVYYEELKRSIDIKNILDCENSFYYENDGYSFVGLGNYIKLDKFDDVERYLSSKKIINEINIPFTGGIIGSFSYEIGNDLEKIKNKKKNYINGSRVNVLFTDTYYVYIKNKKRSLIVSIQTNDLDGLNLSNRKINEFLKMSKNIKKSKIVNENCDKNLVRSNISKENFIKNVERAKEYIKEGDIFQIVLSQRFEVKTKKSPIDILYEIEHEKSTFKYYFKFKDFSIIGISPEILISKENNVLKTNPIAGTRRRGTSEEEDQFLEKELLNDEKEISEHTMLVDLARNDMGRVSEIDSVKVIKFKKIKKYKTVMHIVSEVIGKSETSSREIVKAFIPAGTVSGAPKVRAMEIIGELENDSREIYGGGIGYLSSNNNLELCIAIRTMIIKDEIAYIQAGAGIVYDSIAEREFEETKEKANQLLSIVGRLENDFVN